MFSRSYIGVSIWPPFLLIGLLSYLIGRSLTLRPIRVYMFTKLVLLSFSLIFYGHFFSVDNEIPEHDAYFYFCNGVPAESRCKKVIKTLLQKEFMVFLSW